MAIHTEKPSTPGEALQHYGVKGMRWGVRKKEETSDRDAARANVEAKSKVGITTPSSGRTTSAPTPKFVRETVKETLSPDKEAKKQARVDEFMKRADLMDTKISEAKIKEKKFEGTKNPVKMYEKYGHAQDRKQFERAKKTALKDAEATNHGKLTSKQKQVVIGALAVGGILGGGYLATRVVAGQQSGAFNSYQLLAKAKFSGKKVPFDVKKELSGPMSAEELLHKVAKPVNPLYSTPGGKMNCRRSTYAYELRRRGFDVRATTSSVGWGQSESGVINAVTKDGKDFFSQMSMSQSVVDTGFSSVAKGDTRINPLKKILLDGLDTYENPVLHPGGKITGGNISSSAKVLAEIAKQPHGARGEVLFKFEGFGHSMAYENIHGVPHIFDSQKGTLYNASKMVESKWDGFHSAELTRLDNVDLDINFLTRWATNVDKVKDAAPAQISPNYAGVNLLSGIGA